MSERTASLRDRLRAARGRIVLTLVLLGIVGAVVWARVIRPLPVLTQVVERGEVVEQVYGRGTIESDREAQLGFDLVGRLSEVLVDEGTRVTLGQELARLAPEQIEAELRTASMGVSAARTSLTRLAAEERRVRTALEAAQRELDRLRPLVGSGAVASHELDLADDQARLLRADLDRVLAQRAEATRGIEVASGSAEQRRVTVLRATLLAPFDGLVTRRLREPGDTVTVGSEVLRLVDTEEVRIRAWVDETTLPRLREGLVAQIRLPGREASIAGRVSRVGWESDRQTHELLVDVEPTESLGRFAIGQRADVWIETTRHEDVAQVPEGFLARDDEGAFVYVDDAGRIERRRLSIRGVGVDLVGVDEGVEAGTRLLRAPSVGGRLVEGRTWEERP
ncbi:MAG: efflux RND transporter periplasmic adaptor subunit [Sandaracinus sp.]|nr:efflux RND transporter periplasmic adaptor subunit [Sandaracinus sp.]